MLSIVHNMTRVQMVPFKVAVKLITTRLCVDCLFASRPSGHVSEATQLNFNI